MRRSLPSGLRESGLNDNQMRSLWQDKGVVEGCFRGGLDRGVAPEVFVAAVFDMLKSVFLFVEKLNFVSRETIMPIFQRGGYACSCRRTCAWFVFVLMLWRAVPVAVGACFVFFAEYLSCVAAIKR